MTVEGGQATELRGIRDHPFTRGGLCAKVNHFLERVYSPERLLHPLRRTGPKGSSEFARASWDEALDAIAERLRAIVTESGGEAVLPYSYLGTQGVVQGMSMDRRFFARLGATQLRRDICGSTPAAGITATLGRREGLLLPEELVHSRFLVLWGTNTIVTNLHLWPFVREAKERGATVVVVDPLKTRTAQSADWHVRPLPGTDGALALGMMHVIVAEGLHDADYVERHTVGFEQLRERLEEYPPERCAELTGLEAQEIVDLARAYATTRPAAIRTLIGMGHHGNGAMTARTIACLPVLVGAVKERGGGLAGTTGYLFGVLDLDRLARPELLRESTREVNMVQLGRALTELEPPIRALVVYNSNPAAIAPNQELVLQGLRREDLFTVVLEQFLTDTARHADYVLPATTQVEHLDLVPSWGHTYLTLNRPAIEPRGEALPNSEVFRRLARRLGFEEPCFRDSDEDLARQALASGHPFLAGITYQRLCEEGWAKLAIPDDWRPHAKGAFATPSGKCELYSEALAARGLDPLPGYTPPAELQELGDRYPLRLLTTKSALHFLNSSYANLPRHLRAEKEPLLDLHPDDAAPRGIGDGDQARVFNDRGSLTLRARVGDRVRPGVVAVPSGWWASLSPGGRSANALTRDDLADWGGGGDFHDTLVEVARAG